jgi:hypothetical protein
MNHFMMTYKMENGQVMRQSMYSNDDLRGATKAWEKKTGKKCIGGCEFEVKGRGTRPYHIKFDDGTLETVSARTGAEAITKAYDKHKKVIVNCQVDSIDSMGGGRMVYDVPKLQQASIPVKRLRRKSSEGNTAAFDFLKEVDKQCGIDTEGGQEQ